MGLRNSCKIATKKLQRDPQYQIFDKISLRVPGTQATPAQNSFQIYQIKSKVVAMFRPMLLHNVHFSAALYTF